MNTLINKIFKKRDILIVADGVQVGSLKVDEGKNFISVVDLYNQPEDREFKEVITYV